MEWPKVEKVDSMVVGASNNTQVGMGDGLRVQDHDCEFRECWIVVQCVVHIKFNVCPPPERHDRS